MYFDLQMELHEPQKDKAEKWSKSLFKTLDLEDLLSKNKIINNLNEVQVGEIGSSVGTLNERAVAETNLSSKNYCKHGYDRCALRRSRSFK